MEATQAEMRGHQDQAADLAAAHEDLAHQVCSAISPRECHSNTDSRNFTTSRLRLHDLLCLLQPVTCNKRLGSSLPISCLCDLTILQPMLQPTETQQTRQVGRPGRGGNGMKPDEACCHESMAGTRDAVARAEQRHLLPCCGLVGRVLACRACAATQCLLACI